METWIKFQIDYIERMLCVKLKNEDKEFLSWYLKLSKEEKNKFNLIRKEIKNNEELLNSTSNSSNSVSNISVNNL